MVLASIVSWGWVWGIPGALLGVPITIAGTVGYLLAGLPHQALLPPLSIGDELLTEACDVLDEVLASTGAS